MSSHDKDYVAFDIIRDLERLNFAITETEVSTTGSYMADDAFWNYLDVRHTDVMHASVVSHAPFFVSRNSLCSLLVMRSFGMRVPLVLAQYFDDTSTLHTLQSLAFGFLLKSTIRMIQETDETTTVTVHYYVASSRVLKFLHPFLVFMLRRNFRKLMSEDTPMRDRKMELRKLGFVNVGGSDRDYMKTLNIGMDNIKYEPSRCQIGHDITEKSIEIVSLKPGRRERVTLDSEKSFLCVRHEGQVLVYQSYCSHEGADLGEAIIEGDRMVCPWHGRRHRPLARLELGKVATLDLRELGIRIVCEETRLRFEKVGHEPGNQVGEHAPVPQ